MSFRTWRVFLEKVMMSPSCKNDYVNSVSSMEKSDGAYAWKRADAKIGERRSGDSALAYLRDRQGDFLDFMASMQNGRRESLPGRRGELLQTG